MYKTPKTSDKFDDSILIFCDGASSGNPGPGGWGAILIQAPQVQELGGFSPSTTNNRMEMTAAIEALSQLNKNSLRPASIHVHTDSTYLIRGITQWIFAWKKRGWKTATGEAVENQDLWEELQSLLMSLKKNNSIEWKYVRGHSGYPGNERVDEIAVQFSKRLRPSLYQGPLKNYPVNYLQLPTNFELPPMKSPAASGSKKAATYLSLVGQTLQRHTSWKECEARVKGVSGAKYKKVESPEEEEEIKKKWGV